jgi:hypothetical protein
MTITQTVELPADRRITLEVPQEVPIGPVVLIFSTIEEAINSCPECVKYRDSQTGELRLNAKTVAGMQEVDDMLSERIPNKLKSFNSLEEMLADLDTDD